MFPAITTKLFEAFGERGNVVNVPDEPPWNEIEDIVQLTEYDTNSGKKHYILYMSDVQGAAIEWYYFIGPDGDYMGWNEDSLDGDVTHEVEWIPGTNRTPGEA